MTEMLPRIPARPEPNGRRANPVRRVDYLPGPGYWEASDEHLTLWAVSGSHLHQLTYNSPPTHKGQVSPGIGAIDALDTDAEGRLWAAVGTRLFRLNRSGTARELDFIIADKAVGVAVVGELIFVASADGNVRGYDATGDLVAAFSAGKTIVGLAHHQSEILTLTTKVVGANQTVLRFTASGDLIGETPPIEVKIWNGTTSTAGGEAEFIAMTGVEWTQNTDQLRALTPDGRVSDLYVLSNNTSRADVEVDGDDDVPSQALPASGLAFFDASLLNEPPEHPELSVFHAVSPYWEDTAYTEQLSENRWVSVVLSSNYNGTIHDPGTNGYNSALCVYLMDTTDDEITVVSKRLFVYDELFPDAPNSYPYAHSFARLGPNEFIFAATDYRESNAAPVYIDYEIYPGWEGNFEVKSSTVAFRIVGDAIELIDASMHPWDMEFGMLAGSFDGAALWFHHDPDWARTFSLCTEFHLADGALTRRTIPLGEIMDAEYGGYWTPYPDSWGTDGGPAGGQYLGNGRWCVSMYANAAVSSEAAEYLTMPARMDLVVLDVGEQLVRSRRTIFEQYTYNHFRKHRGGTHPRWSLMDHFWPIADYAKSVNHMARHSNGTFAQVAYRHYDDGQGAQHAFEFDPDEVDYTGINSGLHYNPRYNDKAAILVAFFRISGDTIELTAEHELGTVGDRWWNGSEFYHYDLGLFNCHGVAHNDDMLVLPVSYGYLSFDWEGRPLSNWAWYPGNHYKDVLGVSRQILPYDTVVDMQQTHKWPERISGNRVLVFSYDWWTWTDPIFSWSLFSLDPLGVAPRATTRFPPDQWHRGPLGASVRIDP